MILLCEPSECTKPIYYTCEQESIIYLHKQPHGPPQPKVNPMLQEKIVTPYTAGAYTYTSHPSLKDSWYKKINKEYSERLGL